MSATWLVGYEVAFSDGGAASRITGLSRNARDLAKSLTLVTTAAKDASGAINDVAAAAERATGSTVGLARAMTSAASAGSAAGAGARSAGSGFQSAGAAANRAAADVARFNAMMVVASGAVARAAVASGTASFALPTIAGGVATRALPAASPYSLYGARQYALPPGASSGFGPIPQPAYRSAATAAIASAPQLALTGGRDPAFNARAWWANQRASGTSFGGGPTIGVPPGGFAGGGGGRPPWHGFGLGTPFGGGGGGGGMPLPVGGPMGMAAQWAGGIAKHVAIDAVKYGAEAAAGYAIDAVHEAGHFQTILQSTQNVTAASRTQMERVRAAAYDVGNQTAMSPSQAAEMFREISRQSQGAMKFDDMLGMLPYAAKMQVVLGAARGFSPHQTIDATMALTHLFRQYDPKGMPKMFDTVLRMGELMPDDLGKAVTQMGYFLPTAKSLHIKDEDTAAIMVALSRFGMGRQKGGTSIQNLLGNALGPLQLTQHAQKGKSLLLGAGTKNAPGLDVLDAHGKSRFFTNKSGDIFGFLDKLAEYQKKYGSALAHQTFEGAFGKQGTRIADMFSSPELIEQLHNIVKALKDQQSLGLKEQSQSITGTAQYQEKRAWQNFQALATELGTLAIPGVTKGFHDLGDAFHSAQQWLAEHKDLEKHISDETLGYVKETEKWLVGHKSDLEMLGKDALAAFDNLGKVGEALSKVADAAFEVYRFAHSFVTTSGGGAIRTTDKDGRTVYVNPDGSVDYESTPHPTTYKDLSVGPTRPVKSRWTLEQQLNQSPTSPAAAPFGPGPRVQRTRDVVVQAAVQIQIVQQPGQDPHQLATAVKDHLDKHFRRAVASGSHPQHGFGKHAGGVTHPNMPTVVTVPRH